MRLRPPETPETTLLEQSEFGTFWGADLFKSAPTKHPLIEHFLYERDAIFITAQPGVGKSILSIQIMGALTSGQPFLDAFKVTKPCNVLYLQTEGDRAETLQRIKSMEKAVKFDHNRWVHVNLDGICLNDSDGMKNFMQMIEKPQLAYDVIIIDPLYTTVKGSLSNDDVATDWIRQVRKIKAKYNCAFVVVHHDSVKEFVIDKKTVQRGDKDLMGSTFWGAFGSYNFRLAGNRERGFTLTRGKERKGDIIDKLELRLIEPDPLCFVVADTQFSLSKMQVLKLIEDSEQPVPVKDIIVKTALSRATVYRVLRALQDSEKIDKIDEGQLVKYKKKEVVLV